MDIFDILGPVMVGPSSSHTAGAARIGAMARTLLGEEVADAKLHLYGSFAETGKGHGTDRALVAGLLGMKPDDLRIPNAFVEAKKAGLRYTIDEIDLLITDTGISDDQVQLLKAYGVKEIVRVEPVLSPIDYDPITAMR